MMYRLNAMGSAIQKKLLVIESDKGLLNDLQKCLGQNGSHVDGYVQGEVLPALLERQQSRFDLVVLDAGLPGENGFYWLKWLQQYHVHLPVIITSECFCEKKRLSALEHGAWDYVLKPFRERELSIRIENILGKQVHDVNSSHHLRIGDVRVDVEKHYAMRDGRKISLTQLELKIIKLLYLNVGKPLSRSEIMAQIHGIRFNPMDRSIDIHINKLRKKIEVNPSKPVYILTVRGKGYSLQLP